MLRTRLSAVLLVAALVAGLAACDDDDDDEPTAPAEAPAEIRSFIGDVPGTDALVAVVVPSDGDTQAYVCDGRRLIEFFSGPASGPTIDLGSEDGDAALSVEIGDETASGSVTTTDGEILKFEAETAAEPAGLYSGEVSADGTLQATAATGAELGAGIGAGDEVTGTITSSDGDETDVFLGPAADTKPGPFRLIYAEDGTAKGGKFGGEGKRSLGFINEVEPF